MESRMEALEGNMADVRNSVGNISEMVAQMKEGLLNLLLENNM